MSEPPILIALEVAFARTQAKSEMLSLEHRRTYPPGLRPHQ
jgi:hypothetical protein